MQHQTAYSLEEALDAVGTGRFQWLMLAICGLANAADATEIMSVGLVGTAAEEAFSLTNVKTGILNAAMLVGMLFGGLLWGMLGDRIGRKRSLVIALMINAKFGAMSAMAMYFPQLIAMRVMSGVGVGGSMPVVFTLMSELCPASSRGRFMAMLAACWMLGSLFSASAGWLMLPHGGSSWRWFIVVASLPAWICMASMHRWAPESPRYLLVKGRRAEAEQVLRAAAIRNGRPLPDNFVLADTNPDNHEPEYIKGRVSDVGGGDLVSQIGNNAQPRERVAADYKAGYEAWMPVPAGGAQFGHVSSSVNNDNSTAHGVNNNVTMPLGGNGSSSSSSKLSPSAQQPQQQQQQQALVPWKVRFRLQTQRSLAALQTVLQPPLLAYTLPLALAWVGLSGGWYCTVLWVPKYFELRGATSGSIYTDTFAVSLANLPGNVASIFLVDALGRRRTACLCMAGGCICALLFAAAPAAGGWPLAAACVFNAVSVPGWNALDMISAELYPTTVRSTGFGLLNSIGRLASIITTYSAGALLTAALWAPLLLAALLLAVGSIAMMLLPEPAGKPLQDNLSPPALSCQLSGAGSIEPHGGLGVWIGMSGGTGDVERVRLLTAVRGEP